MKNEDMLRVQSVFDNRMKLCLDKTKDEGLIVFNQPSPRTKIKLSGSIEKAEQLLESSLQNTEKQNNRLVKKLQNDSKFKKKIHFHKKKSFSH